MDGTFFDLVMFDLDGTLVATAPELCDAVNDTLRRFGLPEVREEQVEGWIGEGARELLVQALAYSGDTDAATVRASDCLAGIAAEFDRNHRIRCGTRSRVYPQVRETLTALRTRGVKLAVVTNKETGYAQAVLDAHRLSPLLDFVVSGDTLATRKPHPAGVEWCLARFGALRHRALFVGDSSIDVATARNADVAVWALPYGYNRGRPIEASGPDRVIADCSSLLHGRPRAHSPSST